jgi:hypothetical protein
MKKNKTPPLSEYFFQLALKKNIMSQSRYHIKRLLAIFNPKKLFRAVGDNRQKSKSKRSLSHILQVIVEGFMSGIFHTRALECFSESKGARIPYSSLVSILNKADSQDLGAVLAKVVKEAHRDHVFTRSMTLPIMITAVDGKRTGGAKKKMTEHFVDDGNGKFYCKALRAALISIETPVFLGQHMLRADQGEPDQAVPFLANLIQEYGRTNLLHTFSLDAGFASKKLVDFIAENKYHYIQRIKGNQPTLHGLLEDLFTDSPIPLVTEHIKKSNKTVIRELYRIKLENGLGQWEHVQEAWYIKSTTTTHSSGAVETLHKYYLTNLPPVTLNDDQVLLATRSHWKIENNGFFTLDYTFKEDDLPLTNTAPEQVSLLRLIAYNFIALGVEKKPQRRKRVLGIAEIMDMLLITFGRFDLEFPDRSCPAFL